MSFREKTAWLSLIAMAVTIIPYFTIVRSHLRGGVPLPDFRQLTLFAVVMTVQAILQIAGQLYLRFTSRVEARTPPDERDRAIEGRSMSFAYYVLIAGMILVGCIMPFASSGWAIVNAAVFMITIAEVVHKGVSLVSYRRQA